MTDTKRQIILDTETTGLRPEDGHRVIEIGAVEMVGRRLTGRTFHVYLNPEREVDAGAVEVHGLSNEFLADKPVFGQVVDDLIAFIAAAELVIHNAPFDVGFLDNELSLSSCKYRLAEDNAVFDTLVFARSKHPGQRNSLDALCKRYGINNSHRELHGALLDAEILADVYLLMTGGQASLWADEDNSRAEAQGSIDRIQLPGGEPLSVIQPTTDEQSAHQQRLAGIEEQSGQCLWLELWPEANEVSKF